MSKDKIIDTIITGSLEQPSKEIGDLISQPIKALKYFIMNPIIKYNIAKESEYKNLEKELGEKIEKINPENLKEANIRILAGVNEGLKFTAETEDLRKAFLNLLASSIDKSKEQQIHVSFPEILKQLEPDEARIIEYLNSGSNIGTVEFEKNFIGKNFLFGFILNGRIPKVDVYKVLPNKAHREYIKNFTWLSFMNFIEEPNKLNIYFDNLVRLNLIEINSDKYIKEDLYYKSILTEHPKIKNFINNEEYDIQKGFIQLTEVGFNFAKCCCDNTSLKNYEIDSRRFLEGNVIEKNN